MKQEKSRQNKPPAGPGTSSAFCRANARCWWHGCACTKLYAYCFHFFWYRNNIQHECLSLSLNIGITPMDQRDPPLRKGVNKINSCRFCLLCECR